VAITRKSITYRLMTELADAEILHLSSIDFLNACISDQMDSDDHRSDSTNYDKRILAAQR